MNTAELFEFEFLQLKRAGIKFFETNPKRKLLLAIVHSVNVIFLGIVLVFSVHYLVSNFTNVILAAEAYCYVLTVVFNILKMIYIRKRKLDNETVIQNLKNLSNVGEENLIWIHLWILAEYLSCI